MKECPGCQKPLSPVRLKCGSCEIAVDGEFKMSRLARLPSEHQSLAEDFIMSGGSMKDLSVSMDISYPTLRKRVDEMMRALSTLRDEDDSTTSDILNRIEIGEITAEKGMRLIKEMGYEA